MAGDELCALAGRALGAEPADDEFALAYYALAERSGGGAWHGVPVDVLDVAAAIANEVMMLAVFGVIARGAAFGGDLAHQARADEIAQIVIGGRAGRLRVHTIDGFEDLGCGGVFVVRHQERHDTVALRREAQPAMFELLPDLLRVHY